MESPGSTLGDGGRGCRRVSPTRVGSGSTTRVWTSPRCQTERRQEVSPFDGRRGVAPCRGWPVDTSPFPGPSTGVSLTRTVPATVLRGVCSCVGSTVGVAIRRTPCTNPEDSWQGFPLTQEVRLCGACLHRTGRTVAETRVRVGPSRPDDRERTT